MPGIITDDELLLSILKEHGCPDWDKDTEMPMECWTCLDSSEGPSGTPFCKEKKEAITDIHGTCREWFEGFVPRRLQAR